MDSKHTLTTDDDTIRSLELGARVEAVKAEIAGYQAENSTQAASGQAPVYGIRFFEQARSELNWLADEIKEILDRRKSEREKAKNPNG